MLGKSNYNKLMLILFDRYKFKYKRILSRLFLNKINIKKLHSKGHEVGLHSHSHPTLLNELSYKEQKKEYNLNKKKVKKILKNSPIIW